MNVLCFSLKSKNKGLNSKSKDYSMDKRKGTIGQTMIYKNKLHKLQRKLKTEKQELKIGGELRCIGRAKQFLLY